MIASRNFALHCIAAPYKSKSKWPGAAHGAVQAEGEVIQYIQYFHARPAGDLSEHVVARLQRRRTARWL